MLEPSSSILRVKLHTALIIEALEKKARGATELAGVKNSQSYLLLILLAASWETIDEKSYTLPREDFLKGQGEDRDLMSKYSPWLQKSPLWLELTKHSRT